MMLIILLLTHFTLCWAGKPLDYTPLLQFLDQDIVRELTEPLEGRGKDLIDFLKTYNSRLEDVREMIDQNVYEAYIKAIELEKIGGPQFLKANINKEQLKTVFSWTDENLTQLQELFESTKKNWNEVKAKFSAAELVFKRMQEEDAKEKAEQAKREQERVEKLRKTEEEFSQKVTVNLGTAEPSVS